MLSTEYVFSIPGIMCSSCVGTVNGRLKSQHTISLTPLITIETAQASELTKQVTITIKENNVPVDVVMAAINAQLPAGLQCTSQVLPSNVRMRVFFGLIGVVGGLALLILPFIMTGLPMLPIAIISTIITFILGASSYRKAASIFFMNGGLHMDTLFAVSTLTALGVSIAAFFVPGLPMMFEAGLLIFGFRHIGEAIRESLEKRMGFQMRFQDKAPKKVNKVSSTGLVETLSADLMAGDVFELTAGMISPVDATYLSGDGFISNDLNDGLDHLLSAKLCPKILAGMVVERGSIRLTVTQPVALSSLVRFDQLEKSLNHEKKSSWETKANQYLRYFIPGVFLLSAVSGVVVGLLFTPSLAILCAISVLVSACPCTLGLVTGLSVYVGMKKASDAGMNFNCTQELESAYQTDCVVWDLNGTLTTLRPEITSVVVEPNCDEHEFLSYCLSLESFSNKSIANSICEYAKARGISEKLIVTQEHINKANHNGISATIEGVAYHLGNSQLMSDHNIAFEEPVVEFDETAIYLARDGHVLGHIIVKRPLRAEAIVVVAALEAMGKRNYIFSGADGKTVKAYAKKLNIPEQNLKWGCTPESKVQYIEELQKDGHRVAMIGDEENDAPAIAAADFGVAMPVDGKPYNMSQQQAKAVFTINSLEPILAAFEISLQTAKTIGQNLRFSILYNVIASLLSGGILLPLGIALNAGVGVFLMILQTCGILLNTYRFKQEKLLDVVENDVKTSSYSLMDNLGLSKQSSRDNLDSANKPRNVEPSKFRDSQCYEASSLGSDEWCCVVFATKL